MIKFLRKYHKIDLLIYFLLCPIILGFAMIVSDGRCFGYCDYYLSYKNLTVFLFIIIPFLLTLLLLFVKADDFDLYIHVYIFTIFILFFLIISLVLWDGSGKGTFLEPLGIIRESSFIRSALSRYTYLQLGIVIFYSVLFYFIPSRYYGVIKNENKIVICKWILVFISATVINLPYLIYVIYL